MSNFNDVEFNDEDLGILIEMEYEDHEPDLELATDEEFKYPGLEFTGKVPVLADSKLTITRWAVEADMTPLGVQTTVKLNDKAAEIEAAWPHIGGFVQELYPLVARQVHISGKGGVYRSGLQIMNNWFDTAKHNAGVGDISMAQVRTLIKLHVELTGKKRRVKAA